MNNLLDVIKKERWTGNAVPDSYDIAVRWHNAGLNAIAKAAKQPRVMKLWSDNCKPEKSGWYWYQKKTWKTPQPMYYNHNHKLWFESSAGFESLDENPDNWLELEPTPILP